MATPLATRPSIVTVDTPVGPLVVEQRPASHQDRPVVVLRHGIFLDRSLWSDVASALTEHAHLVLIDGPGHGESSGAQPGWRLADDADATVAVLDALGVERAVLVGHSWGGMASVRTALAHPDRVSGLGLVNTPLAASGPARRRGYRAMRRFVAAAGSPRWFGRQAARSLFDPSAARGPVATRMIEGTRGARRADLVAAIDAVLVDPGTVLPRLGELRHLGERISVVAGVDDYVMDEPTMAAIADAWPAATVDRIAGRHVSPAENPHRVARALSDLLDRVGAASAR